MDQTLNTSLIEIKFNGHYYSFDLKKSFNSLNQNGKIIEATIKNYPHKLYNSDFFRLKEQIKTVIPIAVDVASKLILEDSERNVIYNQDLHYFEITDIEILKYSTNSINIQLDLLCLDENGEILYSYDTRGLFCIEFLIDNLGGIEILTVS